MVKFSREYEASIIPKWKGAIVDYKCLKKLIRKIKNARRDEDDSTALSAAGARGFAVLNPVRSVLAARFSSRVHAYPEDEESSVSSGELVRPAAKHEREFLERADQELEKVSSFYATQEAELLGRGEALIDQLRILADIKGIIADHAASRRACSMPATAQLPPPELSGSGQHGRT